MTASAPLALTRQFVKLCDLTDFDDPELRAAARDIAPGRSPEEELHRKLWEYAMLGLFLRDAGSLREDARILAVGAGHEEPLYWLANRVGHVLATDIYGEGGFAGREAAPDMLTDPSAFAPYPYREDRLEVRHMDARHLDLPDASFDAVFSLSSIEHFGGPEDVARAAREIGRVLLPGGVAAIVTECLVDRHLLDDPRVQFAVRIATLGRRCRNATPRRRITDTFTPQELERDIVRPSGLRLLQPLDLTLSPQTRATVIRWHGAGELRPTTGRPYPHVLLQAQGSPWTSVFLALAKS